MKTHNEVDLCLAIERACKLALKVWEGRPLTGDDRAQAGMLATRLKEIGVERAAVAGIRADYPEMP